MCRCNVIIETCRRKISRTDILFDLNKILSQISHWETYVERCSGAVRTVEQGTGNKFIFYYFSWMVLRNLMVVWLSTNQQYMMFLKCSYILYLNQMLAGFFEVFLCTFLRVMETHKDIMIRFSYVLCLKVEHCTLLSDNIVVFEICIFSGIGGLYHKLYPFITTCPWYLQVLFVFCCDYKTIGKKLMWFVCSLK